MLRLILARLAGGLVVLWAVATLGFVLLRAAPGGPFDEERRVPPEVLRNLEDRYDPAAPPLAQYGRYLADLARLDLGHSMKRPQRVAEILGTHAPYSARLGLAALAFAVPLGLALGVLAAARRHTGWDRAATAAGLAALALPSFVVGPLLILIFALTLFWLPPARAEGPASYLLPAITLGLGYLGAVARLTRAGLLEVLHQDFIRTACAKGAPEAAVVWRHGLRLGVVPVLGYLGPATAALITGSFVVEKIFQIPGLGYAFVAAIGDRDYPVLTGLLVFYAALLVTLNLLVDVAHRLLDPRLGSPR
jgi:oligopeptide transport system permease protein